MSNNQSDSNVSGNLFSLIKGISLRIVENGAKVVSVFNQRRDSIEKIVKANEEITKGIERQLVETDKCTQHVDMFQQQFEVLLTSSEILADKAEHTDQKLSSQIVIDKTLQQHFYNIMESIRKLSSNTGNIKGIVKMILRIAQQINLLSINASIEAARAGDAGRGFAAVAEEIKRLTHETKNAAEDISQLVSTISNDIQNTLQLSDDAKNDFASQDQKIEQSNKALNEIHVAMEELVNQQKEVSSQLEKLIIEKMQLFDSIMRIAQITEQNSATSQMVTSITLEQSSRDSIVSDMLHSEEKLAEELCGNLPDIEANSQMQKKLKIGFISLEQSEFYREIEQAAAATAENLGVEIAFQAPKRFDPNEQANIFRSFVEQEFDGIAVAAAEPKLFASLIDKAVERGVRIACFDMDVEKSTRHLYVTSDSYQGGRTAGEAAARHLKGKGKVLVLLCAASAPTIHQRYQGFYDIISQYPDIVIARKEEQMDTEPMQTRALINNLIQTHPDFDLFYTVTGESGEIAISVWKEKRLAKKLVILSNGRRITEAIREGIVSSQIILRNKLWGELSVACLTRLLRGVDVPALLDTGTYELNNANLPIFENYG